MLVSLLIQGIDLTVVFDATHIAIYPIVYTFVSCM